MTETEWVEKEVAKRPDLSARERSVLRDMLKREHDFWEREAVRVDNHTGHDDQ